LAPLGHNLVTSTAVTCKTEGGQERERIREREDKRERGQKRERTREREDKRERG